MPLPTGRLSRGTIISEALKKAGNTKLTAAARIKLNRILENLYLEYDWPWLTAAGAFSIGGASFALPGDFLKPADDAALYVTSVNGVAVRHEVREVDRETYERVLTTDTTADRPTFWCVDYTNSLGLVYPTPVAPVSATLRYKTLPADVDVIQTAAYDADIPTFPYHNYLIDAVYQYALEHDEDLRANEELAKLKLSLAQIRGTSNPLRSQPQTIPLEPSRFRTPPRRW